MSKPVLLKELNEQRARVDVVRYIADDPTRDRASRILTAGPAVPAAVDLVEDNLTP
jgi:hypothetical protein